MTVTIGERVVDVSNIQAGSWIVFVWDKEVNEKRFKVLTTSTVVLSTILGIKCCNCSLESLGSESEPAQRWNYQGMQSPSESTVTLSTADGTKSFKGLTVVRLNQEDSNALDETVRHIALRQHFKAKEILPQLPAVCHTHIVEYLWGAK